MEEVNHRIFEPPVRITRTGGFFNGMDLNPSNRIQMNCYVIGGTGQIATMQVCPGSVGEK